MHPNSINDYEKRPDMNDIEFRALSELRGLRFRVPYQQRGYKWRAENVLKLLRDFEQFLRGDKMLYCLQPLAVVKCQEEHSNSWVLLDGQQRLTTLFLLHKYLFESEPYVFDFERDSDLGEESFNRWEYLCTIDQQGEYEDNIDSYFYYNAYKTIRAYFCERPELKERFKTLLTAPQNDKSVQVIWYQVAWESQHETFQNLNSGKIALNNTELIKAVLLNRVSGLPAIERAEAAAQFEHIAQAMQSDRLWYMLMASEVGADRCRMDLLLNLVAGCDDAEYEQNPYCSFSVFEERSPDELSKLWAEVRHTFLRLKDWANDFKIFHYIGFLTYCNELRNISHVRELLEVNQRVNYQGLIDYLRTKITPLICNNTYKKLTDYSYESDKKKLRQLFVLHNIETLITKYEFLRESKNLQDSFEVFPFELLSKQTWDIEHIASQTTNDLNNKADQSDWLESIKKDLELEGNSLNDNELELEKQWLNSTKQELKTEAFDKLFTSIMKRFETSDSIPEPEEVEASEGKNRIGNLTLLDSKTNRGYHNALFPKKRRTVIKVDGQREKGEEIMSVFIPPCTRQVFTKAYNTASCVNLNNWTLRDAEAYERDMQQKLNHYFKTK